MNSLTLKYHGLPGIGVNGLPGSKGAAGHRVYFGHINRFFNLETIDLSEYVKLGVRNVDISVNYSGDTVEYQHIIKELTDYEIKSIANASTVIYDTSSVDPLSTSNHRFYTGGIVSNDAFSGYFVDIDNNTLLIQSMLDLKTYNNILPQSKKYTEEAFEVKSMLNYNIGLNNNKTVLYTSVFKHTMNSEDTTIILLGDDVNALIGTKDYYLTGYEQEDASALVGGPQTTYLDENLNEFGGPSNSYLYVKEAFTSGTNTYMLDTSTSYGIVDMTSTKYAGFVVPALTIGVDASQYVRMFPMVDVSTGNANTYTDGYYAAKSALKIDKVEGNNLFYDSEFLYYGLDNSILYNTDKSFRGIDAVWADVSAWAPFKENEAATREYLYTYTTLSQTPSNKYIRWTDTSVNMVIPTYLDTSTYKVGDTIYFYLAAADTSADIELLYSITLTEDLLNQPVNTENFINAAQIVNPFKVQYLDTKDRRVRSYFGCNVYKDNTNVYSDVSAYTVEAVEGIINSFTNNALLLTDDHYDSSIATYLNLRAYDDKSNYDSSVNMMFDTSLMSSGDVSAMFRLDVSTLRLSSFYVKSDNIYETLEQKKHLEDTNIVNTDGFITPITEFGTYVDSNGAYFGCQLSAEDYFYDTDNENCMYGYEAYDKSTGALVRSEMTSDTSMLIRMDTSTLTYEYYLLAFAATEKSALKYYSKCSGCKYDKITNTIDCSVLGDDTSLIVTESNNIEVITTPISAEECKSIDVSFKGVDSTITIQEIKFNNTALAADDTWSNYWAKITKNNGVYTMDVSNNLPNIKNSNPSTIAEYMATGTEIDASLSNTDSYLFAIRNAGNVIPKTNKRYVRATVKYTKSDVPGEFYETHDIVQPGFTDNRDVPEITLKLHNSINDLEKYNTLENGVLANHFRTYLDVNIEDFYEKWGTYVNENDTSVLLNFTITNIATDPNWKRQYNVPGYILRSTIKMLPDGTNINEGIYQDTSYKNYVKLTVRALEENSDIESLTSKDIYDASMISAASISVDSSYYISSLTTPLDSSDYYIDSSNNEQYVCFTSNVVSKACDKPHIITNGLYDDIRISFKDIDFNSAKNSTYHFAIDYELGNPILSNLYLQFAVTDVSIAIKKANLDTSIFTASIDTSAMLRYEDIDTYLYKLTDTYNEHYTYCSEALDVMFNPVSFIACPTELETSIGPVSLATVKKHGSTEQIKNTLKFYGLPMYTNNALIGTLDSYSARVYNYWKWNSMLLKSKYFQDNIGSVTAKPFDPKTIEEKVSGMYLPVINGATAVFDNERTDAINAAQYCCYIYRSSILGVKSQNGTSSFSYQDKNYDANRYMQYENESPLFASQEASIEIRDEKMLDSMNIWNFEYTTYSSAKGIAANAVLFNGVTNEYANGYMFLKDSQDTGLYGYKTTVVSNSYYTTKIGQFTVNDVYSLVDTKEVAESYVYNNRCDKTIDLQTYGTNEPKLNGYFRTLLYDLRWEYPYIQNGKIQSYRLVSDFDYLAKVASNHTFLGKCHTLNATKFINTDDIIPSAMMYELTPRIAYNTDYKTINCLMLRCPVVGTDNDSLSETESSSTYENQIYELTKRYYQMTGYKRLDPPYEQ